MNNLKSDKGVGVGRDCARGLVQGEGGLQNGLLYTLDFVLICRGDACTCRYLKGCVNLGKRSISGEM